VVISCRVSVYLLRTTQASLVHSHCRQTSIRSGILLEMGKGFRATNGILGEDIGELIMRACTKRVCIPRKSPVEYY
jgi:hypothetical protein